MTLSRLARYPAEYYQILLALPASGEPIDVDYGSPEAAHKERLQIYNFLKFLHRNPAEALRFNNRHNLVTMSIKGSSIIFQLRAKAGSSALAQRLAALAAEGTIAPQDLEVELPTLTHAATDDVSFAEMKASLDLGDDEPTPQLQSNQAVYNKYFDEQPNGGRRAPTPQPSAAAWNLSAPREMPPPQTGKFVPAGMAGEPVPLAPTRDEMLRAEGERIAASNAEGAAAVRAPELSAEMKAYNDAHDRKQVK